MMATDISKNAISNAKINFKKNNTENIEIKKTNLADGIAEKFNIILANLPIKNEIWNTETNSIIEKLLKSIQNNLEQDSEIYIPWASFEQNQKKEIEELFKRNKFNYKIIELRDLGYT